MDTKSMDLGHGKQVLVLWIQLRLHTHGQEREALCRSNMGKPKCMMGLGHGKQLVVAR